MIETRLRTELRVESGRTVTGLAAPFGKPEMVYSHGRHYAETFNDGSLEPYGGAPLHLGHPDPDRVHDERDMPVSPPGQFAPGPEGLYGRWKIARTPAGDHLLSEIAAHRVTGLSVGFQPSEDDLWNADRSAVTRRNCLLLHVAAIPPGDVPQHKHAKIVEVRASATGGRLDGYVAAATMLRRRRLIDAQEAAYQTWRGTYGPADAYRVLEDRFG